MRDTCLTLWVELRSTVNSCVLGTCRSVEWCVQTLSPLGLAVLLKVTVEDTLLSWHF